MLSTCLTVDSFWILVKHNTASVGAPGLICSAFGFFCLFLLFCSALKTLPVPECQRVCVPVCVCVRAALSRTQKDRSGTGLPGAGLDECRRDGSDSSAWRRHVAVRAVLAAQGVFRYWRLTALRDAAVPRPGEDSAPHPTPQDTPLLSLSSPTHQSSLAKVGNEIVFHFCVMNRIIIP